MRITIYLLIAIYIDIKLESNFVIFMTHMRHTHNVKEVIMLQSEVG